MGGDKMNVEPKFIPLYIFAAIVVGCMIFFGIKHLYEAFKEVKKSNIQFDKHDKKRKPTRT